MKNLFTKTILNVRSAITLATIFTLIVFSNIVNATIVNIGAGATTGSTSSNVGPIYRSSASSAFDYSQHYYLYTQAELAAAGILPGAVINSIAWNKASTFGTATANTSSIWQVYMKNSSTLPSASWSSSNFTTQTSGATLVYNNTSQVIPSVAGFIPLTFPTGFIYTGGNLEIGCSWNCSIFAGSPTTGSFSWKVDAISNQTFGGSASTSSISMFSQTSRPQIQFNFVLPPACSGIPNSPTISPATITKCNGQTATMTATGATIDLGSTYQWQVSSVAGGPYTDVIGGTGATSLSYTTAALTTGINYYVLKTTCTNTNDSSYSNEVTVNVNYVPNVSVTSTATSYCPGATPVNLTSSSTDAITPSFGWSAGATPTIGSVVSVSPTSNTIYTVTATTTEGCTAISTIAVISNLGVGAITASASPSSVCFPNTSNLNVATPVITYCAPSTFSSTDDEEIGSITFPATPGFSNAINNTTPNIAVSPIVGTQGTASGTPSIYSNWTASSVPVPTLTAGTTYPFESLSTYTFPASTYGNITIVYIDFNQDGTFGTGESFACPSGTGTRTVSTNITIPTTALNGITRMRVVLNESTTAAAACGAAYSWGEIEDYNIEIVGGLIPYSFAWSSSDPNNPTTINTSGEDIAITSSYTIANPIADYHTTNGSTIYTVTVTNGYGCTKTASVTLSVAGSGGVFTQTTPAISPASGLICSDKTFTILDSVENGGAPYNWTLFDPNNLTVHSITASPNNYYSYAFVPAVSGTYTVSVSDGCNNFNTQTFNLTVNLIPTLSVSSSAAAFCSPSGAPVVLTGTSTGNSPFTNLWTPAAGLSSATSAVTDATPLLNTTYTLTTTDVNGCTKTSTILVNKANSLSLTSVLASPSSLCALGTSTLTATTAFLSHDAFTYCPAGATSTLDEEIANVTFPSIAGYSNQINNTTPNIAVSPIVGTQGTATGSPSLYNDWTASSVPKPILLAGSTYPISVNVTYTNIGSTYSNQTTVYIDFNQDGTFGTGENFNVGAYAGGTRTVTGSIPIPSAAINGITTMRVVLNESSTAPSCGTFSWGEIEDYAIIISNGIGYSAPATSTVVWTPNTYLSSDVANPTIAATLPATTTYTVTASSTAGCTSVSSVTVNVGAALTCSGITSSLGNTFCANFSSTLTANFVGGGAPFTYQWSDAAGNLGTGATQLVNTSGTYSVVVTDNCSQTCMTSITIAVNPNPTVVPTATPALICGSGSSAISATGADTYAWMPGALSGSAINPTITASAIYTVTGTDLNGCTATSTVAVSFDNYPTFTSLAASPVSVCLNGTSTITASAQVGGLVIGGSTATGVLPADNCNPSYSSGTGFGDFIQAVSGIITNTTGANASPYVTSFSNTPPTLNFGTTYTLNVTPGTWSSNDVAVFIDFNRNGILTDAGEKIGEFDNTGSGAVSAFIINIPVSANSGLARLRVVEADQSTTGGMLPCAAYAYGETEDYIVNIVNIQAVPVSSYSWNASPSLNTTNGSAVIASNIGASETYTVTAATALGCTATSTVEVTIAGAVSCSAITSSLGAAFCAGFTSTLTANHVGGGAPYNYQWSDASGNLGTTATQSVTTSGTYSVMVTDNCGQTCVTSIAIIVNTLPTVTASTTNTLVCFSGSASITADGAISYAWMPGSLTGANINPSITANTTFTVTGTDANGCTNTATQSVLFDNFNTTAVSSATSPICVGGTSTISVSDIVPGPTTLPTNYCASSAQFSGDEEIYNFSFNGGSTPSAYAGVNACSTVAPGAGSALDLYSNFTGSLLTTVSTGNTYTYNLVENECNGATFFDFGTAIFVDWNRDGDFNDVDETVLQEASTIIGPRNISGSITVPATATPGYTRMRIMVIESTSGTSLTPCFFGGYGEVEDYTINITSPTTTNSYLWSDPTASTAYSVAVSPAASTTYTVTSTSALGCTKTTTVTVNVAIPAVAASATPATVQLGQTSTLAGTGAATYAWSPSTNLSAATGSSVIATPTALGTLTYAVIGTDANGCTGSGTVALTTVPAVSISLLTNDASCFGQASGTIDVDPIGFTGTVTYSINPSAGSTGGLYTYTNLPAGTYTISATDGTSSTSAVTTISQPATAISAIVTTTGPLCNGDSSGSFNVVGAGGTNFPAGYNYLYTLYDASSNVVAFDSFSAAFPSGSYTMAVEDYNGCIYNAPVTIANTPLLTMSAASTNISCFNLVNGDITVTATGGTGTKLYQLNSSAYQSANTFTSLAAGIYTITTKDANNCTTSATATIIEPSAVSISATAGTILCNGGTADVTLTTNGGTGTIATTPANTGLTAGTYTFTATDANGCSATSVATIAPAPSAVTISATAGTILCNGGTADVTLITNGGTGTIATTPANTGLTAGTYTFTATDANGCTRTSTTIITAAPSAIVFTLTPTQPLCFGQTGTVSFTTSGGTGTIAVINGSTTVTSPNTGLTAGTHTFTATDANGCSATSVATIAPEPSAVSISATAGTILCNGGTANVTLLTGGGTGTITTAPAANNLLGGTYVFTATDANGCTAAASATIINPSLLTATVAANSTSIATGGTLVLTTTPAGLASYNVAGPSISNTGTSNVFSTTVTPANSGVYTISVANTNGCAASTTITITVFAGSKVAIKTMLSGPYDASTGLMWDSLRVKGLIPSTEPYSTAPYNTTYMHVNGGGGETVAPSVLAVTGSNAIVDWVFVQLRSKLDSNIVVATRSALIQRDGDVVDIDGISPVLFANSIPDNYFISIEHRNHLGIMTKGKYALSGAVSTMDLTTNVIPLFAFAGRAGNPAPFTGPTRKIGSVRALYAGNCNIDLALSAYRYITYNASTGGDKTQLFSVTGFGVNTLTGYSLYDCDLNGYARFNGLSPDRLVIYLNCGNSNTNIVNEQTPN